MHFTERTDPFSLFAEWLEEARAHPGVLEPTAMCLATAARSGAPSARMVLLKEHDARGFVFYTNADSRKGAELSDNPQAALCFYWMPMLRQIRIEGGVSEVSAEEADAYYYSRPLDSRLGAWASQQSRPLASRQALLDRVEEFRKQYGDAPPRPEYWRGFRVAPLRIEFWQQGDFRLHDRICFEKTADGWQRGLLQP